MINDDKNKTTFRACLKSLKFVHEAEDAIKPVDERIATQPGCHEKLKLVSYYLFTAVNLVLNKHQPVEYSILQ